MHRRHAFTLTDMCAAVVACGLLLIVSNTVTGCVRADPRRELARRMQNNVHVRGIHSGLVLFCSGNGDHYPGVQSSGQLATLPLPATPGVFGTDSVSGDEVVYRMTKLLCGGYFSPEYMISPSETNQAIRPPAMPTAAQPTPGLIKDGANYSYAMLNISNRKAGRSSEWRGTNNNRAPVISDRNIGAGATGAAAQSIHTKPGDGWQGSVCYNDNHASFESSDIVKTEYAQKGALAADLLFSEAEVTATGVYDADAAMVFKADNAYVNQQP